MSEQETLARVRDDLAAGRVDLARQRLRGFGGSYPQRLDLREQLAELYRRDGILSQAGCRTVLSDSRDPEELRTFEREYPDPVHRMRAIGWRGPEDAAGEAVRVRLAALREEAEAAAGHLCRGIGSPPLAQRGATCLVSLATPPSPAADDILCRMPLG